MTNNIAPVGWIAIIALLITGCGAENPFETVSVSGKVTCKDGAPIAADIVVVHFVPQDVPAVGDQHSRPARATLGADGSFAALSSFARDDGAVPGMHKVVIEAFDAGYTPNTTAIAEQYSSPTHTPLEARVTVEGVNHFELTVERP